MNYLIKRSGLIAWIEFPKLSVFSKLKHFSSLRFGGVSAHPQASLNMGFVKTDLPENVIQNRRLFACKVGISLSDMVFSQQTHSTNTIIPTSDDKGKGVYSKNNALSNNDGYILIDKGICPCVLTADCAAIFFYDPLLHIAAIAHSGWRGTAGRITSKIIQKMIELGSKPSNIIIALGPSIRNCCYTVREDVLIEFNKNFGAEANNFFNYNNNKLHLDMTKAITCDAFQIGVLSKNIEICDLCTHCNPYLFFSARNSNLGMTGRMVSGIMLSDG